MSIRVNLDKNSYDILIKKGALSNVKDYFNLDRKVLILTDDGVPTSYSQKVADASMDPTIFTIKSGEDSKSLQSFQDICKKMLENGFTRNDCVVAVGGGVVGDLAGFVAASYMRGVDFYNIPTTLLSQVDSSIGGKVAVNFCGIKNIIGAFYQPKMVLIDTDVLSTLDERQISNGIAEAVKMSLTFDEDLFRLFETDSPLDNIEEIIEKSLLIKKNVVEQDEKENDIRKVLNFGHTIGHAIESLSFEKLYHGECISIGMLPFCDISIKERVLSVLRKFSLPTTTKHNKSDLLPALTHDKKNEGKKIACVFVDKIGEFRIEKLTAQEILELL